MNKTNDIEILLRAIKNRRSMGVARLSPDAVPRDLIETALEAANWAPSHGETEPWRFTVFTEEGRRHLGEAFAQAYKEDAERDGSFKSATFDSQRARVWSAPVWISLGMEPMLLPDGTPKMGLEEEGMALACAVQNLHLVANAQGLAGMWLSQGVMVHLNVATSIGLNAPHSRLFGFFVLGWPNIPWPKGERKPIADKVAWVTEQ
jgi:nitroreductase